MYLNLLPASFREELRMPDLDPTDERWQLVQLVIQSPQFEKSPRLRSFLLFVCEMELTGKRNEINEHEIGVKVFGRAEGYHPGDDSIVRSQARILRQRLGEYFDNSGAKSHLRITIPKGSYAPTFVAPSDVPSEVETVSETHGAEAPAPKLPKPRHAYWIAAVVVLVLLLATVLWVGFFRHSQAQSDAEAHFWNSLFASKRRAVIVPADSTLVLIEELTGAQVSFEDYQSRKYLANPALNEAHGHLTPDDLYDSHYTSMADLDMVARLMHLPQTLVAQPEIRYARDLSISDAREGNLILVGGARANPWVQLFAGKMNFGVDYDWQRKMNVVVNKAPKPGEPSYYMQDAADPQHRIYGLVAYEPSLDGEGDSLLVSGVSSAGTQAAADFLLSSHLFPDFLRQIRQADGTIPHFELLLAARNLNGNVAGSTIVASRVTH